MDGMIKIGYIFSLDYLGEGIKIVYRKTSEIELLGLCDVRNKN